MPEVPGWADELHGTVKALIALVGDRIPDLTTGAPHPRQMAALYLARVRRLVMGTDALYESQMPDVLGGVLRICFEAWITGMWVLCVGEEAVRLLDADVLYPEASEERDGCPVTIA
jgi:hypothetical protein